MSHMHGKAEGMGIGLSAIVIMMLAMILMVLKLIGYVVVLGGIWAMYRVIRMFL